MVIETKEEIRETTLCEHYGIGVQIGYGFGCGQGKIVNPGKVKMVMNVC